VDTTPSTRPHRWAAALAGTAAVAVALGAGELIAGIVPRAPSPVVAVGTWLIDAAPGWLERTGIALFGTANKLALNIGIVVVSLGVGAALGLLELRRNGPAVAGFLAFGAVGVLASLAVGRPTPWGLVSAIAVVAVAVAAGIVALRALLAAAPTPDLTPTGEWHLRRRFLGLVVGASLAGVVSAAAGRTLLQRVVPTSLDLPRPAEPVAAPPPDLPVPEISPLVTPNRDFFRIDTNLVVPAVETSSWRLRVRGLVERGLTLTLDDLLGMPLVERWITIACVSNEVGGELIGNAAWTGVPLRELLDLAGVLDGATQIVGRAVDGWTAGFPTELAYDGRDALVAVGMNGEALPRRHGAPARLVVAGLYGYVSATKWLEEIELSDWDAYDAYWARRGWAKEGPIRIQSRIDVPRGGGTVQTGAVDVAGVAWAPHVGVTRVEVAIDDGDWQETELGPSLSDHAWRQWHHRWQATAGRHVLAVRATGGDGQTQTSTRRAPFPAGATGYHVVDVEVETV
jgi:DMSO/TMAO reductase YedYZ molybdopterin-dependent catalytic subunit